jgi:serine/threonine protein phosphatase PrpC
MVVANVGDSEIVLCRRGHALALCEVHNPKRNAAEHARIEAEGKRRERKTDETKNIDISPPKTILNWNPPGKTKWDGKM